MYKFRVGLYTKALLQRQALQQQRQRLIRPTAQYYSSLRRVRQPGPRSRVLNHVEPIKRSTRVVEDMAPKAGVEQVLQYDNTHSSEESGPIDSPISHTMVEVPIDNQHQVIKPDSRGAALLTQPAVVVGRELEMMNVFLGYEQANRYKIMDPNGTHLGYIAEEEGFAKSISRQLLRTHRKMNATILNPEGEVVFKIVRPYSLVNSRIFIYTADDDLVGEVQQRWNLVRRKYDLFVGTTQFASIDTPFLGWDFNLTDEKGGTLGNVSRNFVGFAREIFTDTGEYVLRMDAVDGNSRGMTLDERAVTLACAVSIDFDYFSRHSSHGGGGFMPFPMFGMGGDPARHEEDPVGAAGGEAGAAGAAGAGGAVGGAAAGMGSGGYGSSEAPPPMSSPPPPNAPTDNTNEWGDPWLTDEQAGVTNPQDEGGWFDSLSDFFGDGDS